MRPPARSRPEKWCIDLRVTRPRSYAVSDAGRAFSVPWRASGNLASWTLLRASALMYRRCSGSARVLATLERVRCIDTDAGMRTCSCGVADGVGSRAGHAEVNTPLLRT